MTKKVMLIGQRSAITLSMESLNPLRLANLTKGLAVLVVQLSNLQPVVQRPSNLVSRLQELARHKTNSLVVRVVAKPSSKQ